MQEVKELSIKTYFCLQPEKLLLPLIFTENGAGRREASGFPRILTGSGKSLAFSQHESRPMKVLKIG